MIYGFVILYANLIWLLLEQKPIQSIVMLDWLNLIVCLIWLNFEKKIVLAEKKAYIVFLPLESPT
jgi:hypothetical protein